MTLTWTVVASFWSPEEAQIARGFLESQGIACQLENLTFTNAMWHLSNATGGVKLLVESDQAERAAQLLNEVHHTPASGELEDDQPEAAYDFENDEEGDAQHPGLLDQMRTGFLGELLGHPVTVVVVGVILILLVMMIGG